jgi:hypothetical protein
MLPLLLFVTLLVWVELVDVVVVVEVCVVLVEVVDVVLVSEVAVVLPVLSEALVVVEAVAELEPTLAVLAEGVDIDVACVVVPEPVPDPATPLHEPAAS